MKSTSNTVQGFWVAVGSLSTFIVSILSAAILSRYFSKSDYGTYRQVLFIYSTMLVVFSAGLPRVFEFFLPRHAKSQGEDIVIKVSKILFLLGFLFSATLYLLSDIISALFNNSQLSPALKYFSPVPLLLFPTLGIEGIFTSYKKTKYIAIFNVLTKALLLVGITVPVIFFNGNYLSAITGWVIVSFFILIIAVYFKRIAFRDVSQRVKSTLSYKQIFGYSLPLVVASLAGMVIKTADQFYISRYFGPEVFAEFANGFMELPFVSMISGASSAVLMPVFSKMFLQRSSVSDLMDLWSRTLYKSALIIYPLVVFFISFADEIMTVLYTSKYSSSGTYFQIILLLNFFNIIIFAPLFFSMGKVRLYANVHIVLAVVIWSTDYILIQLFKSPLAIALNSVGLSILKTLFFLYAASRLLNVSFLRLFPFLKLFKLTIHAIAVVLMIKYFSNYFMTEYNLVFKLIIFITLYLILIIITAPLFRIDYINLLHPILKKKC